MSDPAYFQAIADRAASRTGANTVPAFPNDTVRSKAYKMMEDETLQRINPTTGEREFMLFRGPSQHDLKSMADNKFTSKGNSSWTTRPDTARGYANSHSLDQDIDPIAAWIPEGKVKNFLPANFDDAAHAPAHSEVILDPIEAAYDTFQLGKGKKNPFDTEIGSLYGNPKKGKRRADDPVVKAGLKDEAEVMSKLKQLVEDYKK